MSLYLRVSKSILIALIMFFSLKYLGISNSTATVVSLIPLVLGSINVLTSVSYMLTGLVFISACASSLLPELHINVKDIVDLGKSDLITKKSK